MNLLELIRDRWINFVTPNVGDKSVGVKKCQIGTLYFPLEAENEDEKYDHIYEAIKILENDIKVCKPKSKSKQKSK